jgi:predicted nucleic acid-binding protein
MKSVVDSSVGVKWGIIEADTDKARRLRDSYRLGQHDLIAPDWFLAEVANAFGKAAARGRMTTAEALQAYKEVSQDTPVLHPSVPLVDDAFQLALKHQRAVYDCLYLALALREKCDLVTADDALVRRLQPIYSYLVALSSLP